MAYIPDPEATAADELPVLECCPYGDPTCPCPDGLACHYEGPDAWPDPRINATN
jgi:hypothetical protein